MRAYRRLVLLTLVLALAVAGCTSGKNKATPGPSDQPTSTPGAEALADFQLVGRAQHAFLGIGPGRDTSATPLTTTAPDLTATPAATGTFGTPGQPGVIRVLLDDVSESLKTNCAAARDEKINVFWTTATQFDTSLLTSDLEAALEGNTVGVVGRLFLAPEGTDLLGEATPSPSTTPGASVNARCILVADQIGTSTGAIPTAVPTHRTFRTSSPKPSPTLTPSSAPTTAPPTTAPPTTAPPTPTST